VGLQIALNPKTEQLEVVAPIAGSPAEKAGIRPRDLQIDGISTAKLTLDEAAARMRGPIGSHVSLVVEREGEAQKFSWCARASPSTRGCRIAFLPSGKPIGYIRLSQFNANATVELAHVLARLEGASAYILDLRNNPGGLLQAGLKLPACG